MDIRALELRSVNIWARRAVLVSSRMEIIDVRVESMVLLTGRVTDFSTFALAWN